MRVFWSHSDQTGSELPSATEASHTGRQGLDETQEGAGSPRSLWAHCLVLSPGPAPLLALHLHVLPAPSQGISLALRPHLS